MEPAVTIAVAGNVPAPDDNASAIDTQNDIIPEKKMHERTRNIDDAG